MLRRARATVAVAESCTGGLLGAVLTAVPGASDYVRGGVIAYADAVKADHLGVSRHLLATHGAVSAEVARAMAAGARQRYGADIGVGITGVAGSGERPADTAAGATDAKPPGVVYVAVVSRASDEVERLEGDEGREGNRDKAVVAALRLCSDAAARLGTGAVDHDTRPLP